MSIPQPRNTRLPLEDMVLHEMLSLREELRDLKSYQFRLVSIAAVVTGFLLSLSRLPLDSSSSVAPSQSLYLLPLVVIVPSWWIFFDKTKTITRIVGYYRILEAILTGSGKAQTFVGWERALGIFRQRSHEVVGRLGGNVSLIPMVGMRHAVSRLHRFVLTMFLIQSQRYWALAYGTFLVLSSICLWFPIRSHYPIKWHYLSLLVHWHSWTAESFLLVTSLAVVSYCALFNGIVLWRLIWGQHSYDFMEKIWEELLDVQPAGDFRSA